MKRKRERQGNNRRAAWNRIGARFNLSKSMLDQAKTSELNPYRVLRDSAIIRESVEAYIQFGHIGEREFDWGDIAIEDEIARARAAQDGEEFDDWQLNLSVETFDRLVIKIMFHRRFEKLEKHTESGFSDLGFLLSLPEKTKNNFGVAENRLISRILRFIGRALDSQNQNDYLYVQRS